MSAIVAGISEEAGFRGYLQGSLERRYSSAAAIGIASVVFGLAHLTHGAFLLAIVFDIGWGALYGLLAYRSGSILPGIVLHSSADALEFFAAWRSSTSVAARPSGWIGSHASLYFSCALVVLVGSASLWAFRRIPRREVAVIDVKSSLHKQSGGAGL
jgi:membrane protease YdiL (CAAX protease family)